MIRRKFMAAGISVFLAAAMFTVPAYAHGHHSRGHHQAAENGCAAWNGTEAGCAAMTDDGIWTGEETRCPVCPVDGCTEAGHHWHEEAVYCGYPHEHGYCDGSCVTAGENGAAFGENNDAVTQGNAADKGTGAQIPDTQRSNSVLPDVRLHRRHHWAY